MFILELFYRAFSCKRGFEDVDDTVMFCAFRGERERQRLASAICSNFKFCAWEQPTWLARPTKSNRALVKFVHPPRISMPVSTSRMTD